MNVNPAVLILFHNESCIKMLFVEQLGAFEYFYVYIGNHTSVFFFLLSGEKPFQSFRQILLFMACLEICITCGEDLESV